MKKLYLGFVRDHSGSMSHLTEVAKADFNALVDQYKTESEKHGFFTQVSTVECGVPMPESSWRNPGYGNIMVNTLVPISFVQKLDNYKSIGNTPLYDAINMLVEQFSSLPDASSNDVQFMVMVMTDGGENASSIRAEALRQKIEMVQSKGNWTITLRVPRGYGQQLVSAIGVKFGNIFEWDGATRESYAESSMMAAASTRNYFMASSLGARSTEKFYTDLSNVSVETIKSTLTDISSQVKVFTTTGIEIIQQFVERMTGQYVKGTAYYQLTKTEDVVQDYKVIIIVDKKTGHIYAGRDARQLLNLPTVGNCKVAPGNHGNYEIFIQSTSINRKLPSGTKLIIWDQMSLAAPVVPARTPTATKVVTKKPVGPKPQVLSGTTSGINTPAWSSTVAGIQSIREEQERLSYKIGYADGKSHKRQAAKTDAYLNGYRDGRNKVPAKFV